MCVWLCEIELVFVFGNEPVVVFQIELLVHIMFKIGQMILSHFKFLAFKSET